MDSPAGSLGSLGLRSAHTCNVYATIASPPIVPSRPSRSATPTGLLTPTWPAHSVAQRVTIEGPRLEPPRGSSSRSHSPHRAAFLRNPYYEEDLLGSVEQLTISLANKDQDLNFVLAAYDKLCAHYQEEVNRISSRLDTTRTIYEIRSRRYLDTLRAGIENYALREMLMWQSEDCRQLERDLEANRAAERNAKLEITRTYEAKAREYKLALDRIRGMIYSNKQAIAHRVAVAGRCYEETLRAESKEKEMLRIARNSEASRARKAESEIKIAIEQHRSELEKMGDKLNNAKKDCEALRGTCELWEKARDSEASRARKAESEIKIAREQHRSELEKMGEKLNNAIKDCEALRGTRELSEKACDLEARRALEAEYTKKTREIKALREQLKNASKDYDELRNKYRLLESENHEAETQLGSARISGRDVAVKVDDRASIEVDENREQLLAVARSLAQRMESMAA